MRQEDHDVLIRAADVEGDAIIRGFVAGWLRWRDRYMAFGGNTVDSREAFFDELMDRMAECEPA